MHESKDHAKLRDDGEMVVAPDGSRIAGWIAEDVHCPVCGGPQVYDMDFDAHFCPQCNEWREVACADPACAYCPGRPERPLPRTAGAAG